MFRKSGMVIICLASSALATPALAQNVYPVQRQSAEQQKQDEARCLTWAMQQSGFDPAKPWLAPQASASTSTAGSSALNRVGTAGTVAGSMTRRDAGDAAVAGAIVAASTQPVAGGATSAITRREAMTAVAGADGAASTQPATGAAAGAMTRRDAMAAVAGADGAAPTPPAANAAAAAILGHDAVNVTAGGAVAGATVRRDANQKIALQQEQAVSQQQLAGEASFQKARTACLEAHGYTVQ